MYNIINGGGVTTPTGFQSSATWADIKANGKERNDLTIIVSDTPCETVALYTVNKVKAACVLYDMELTRQKNKIQAIIVNSGNANACTGVQGINDCNTIVKELSNRLSINEKSILISSTGVIGNKMPVERIVSKLDYLVENLSDDGGSDFASAIMTTDTKSKEIAVLVETSKGCCVIGGACKGAGMIAPSLATMLSFITTDAEISNALMEKMLKEVVEESFNCVTVDGDMSTNDSLFFMSNGMSSVKITESDYDVFKEALLYVCQYLSKLMAIDGEGATKFVKINILGAKSKDDAKLCASKIANSPLVKTMFAGCDPNWGRLMASAGASGADFDQNNVDIFFNNLHYVKNGIIIDTKLEKQVFEIMKNNEYEITINLNAGDSKTFFYTCDFTADYIKINADYRS